MKQDQRLNYRPPINARLELVLGVVSAVGCAFWFIVILAKILKTGG